MKRFKFSKENVKESFHTMTFRHGTYSVAAILLVIVIAIIVNLIAAKLPSSVRQLDISDSRIYEISDTSKKMLKNLDHDIKITVIAEEDSIDERLRTFLEKYTALSDRVTMETVDPVLHPSILTEYDTQSDTLVVECEDTDLSQIIDFSDILVQSMSYYYTDSSSSLSSFDGDGQLTSAISQVMGQETKKLYYVSGHGEAELSTAITNLLEKSGFTIAEHNLLMNGKIPDDCDVLLLNGPTSDITKKEKKLVSQYIKSGGNVTVLMAEQGPETGNLIDLLGEYEINMKKGYIADMERCYQGSYYSIFPNVTASGDMADGLSSGMVLMANSRGFDLGEGSDAVTVSSFLDTSSNGYAVTESREEQGTFSVGVSASYTGQSDDDSEDVTTGSLTVYGSSSIIDQSITESFSSLDNKTLFMNSITTLFSDMDNLSIEAKSLEVQYNTVQNGGYISVILIFVIPLAVLLFGFMFWMRRRKA